MRACVRTCVCARAITCEKYECLPLWCICECVGCVCTNACVDCVCVCVCDLCEITSVHGCMVCVHECMFGV